MVGLPKEKKLQKGDRLDFLLGKRGGLGVVDNFHKKGERISVCE